MAKQHASVYYICCNLKEYLDLQDAIPPNAAANFPATYPNVDQCRNPIN